LRLDFKDAALNSLHSELRAGVKELISADEGATGAKPRPVKRH
jgi:hypothetical protein